MRSENMTLQLTIWRQKDRFEAGNMVDYTITGVSPEM